METENTKFVKFREVKEEQVYVTDDVSRPRRVPLYPYKRAIHPFICRLKETAAFTVTAPNALIAAGFASMGMGLFTLFRPTPVLLFLLSSHIKRKDVQSKSKDLMLVMTLSWDGILMFVLIVLGFVLTFSVKIKKRRILLLHPWGLMALYLDVFVWLALALYLHLEILSIGSLDSSSFSQINHPIVYFIIIYIDSIIFFMLHYVYATYFIAAELSVIEKCY